jgi:hypothetical protein
MAYKVAKGEREEAVDIRDALKEKTEPRLMRELSDKFTIEKVGRIEGKIIYFNEDFFGGRISKEDIEKLSIFADRSGKNTTQELLRLPQHARSVCLVFRVSDNLGNNHNYIEIKGAGMTDKGILGQINTVNYTWGLLDYESAKADCEESNYLLKNGVETSVPLAIIEIKEAILADGKKKSIEELKKQGLIPQTIEYEGEEYKYRPVVYLRAFPEVMRIRDADREDYEKFAKEHGMSMNEYVDWWTEKVAKNIAKIHNLGKVHCNLIGHNLTLDGRIVDNDTVIDVDSSSKIDLYSKDIEDIIFKGFEDLLNFMVRKSRPLFLEKYLENRIDIQEGEFKVMYDMLKRRRVEPEVLNAVEKSFEKKFGKKLED